MVEKQDAFAGFVARLIAHAQSEGYLVTLGEAWRSDETARLNAEEGIGISKSLHRIRLAIDVNLFKNGKLCDKAGYRPIGEWWKSQSTDTYTFAWGGDFDDCDHFSLEHEGIK